ncbi:hypothetical protein N7488_009498 [Penicillium malachiteum]|nr:hypothetical protein N7488_009498 [Penicillium malachiteum]
MFSSGNQLKRVCAAAIDGRYSNVRYIQSQLRVLHRSILDSREEILEVIASNPLTTETEAEVEFCMAVATVRQHYEAIDFDQEIANEYNIANGKNRTERRVGHGVVVCEKNAIDNLLSSLLQPLDFELFGLVLRIVSNHYQLFVQLRSLTVQPTLKRPPNRFFTLISFSGQSPHAPDLIVVNEWVKDKFIDTITRERLRLDREVCSSHANDKHVAWKKAVVEAENKGEAKLIKKEGLYMIDVQQRPEYLVVYYFAEPAAGKFLSQQINSNWSFINHIPAQLLGKKSQTIYHFNIHPIADRFLFFHPLQSDPLFHISKEHFSLGLRYAKEMLSKLKPELIQPTEGSFIGLEDLTNPNSTKMQFLRQRETQPLRETGQRPGTSIGFFEQGIIAGALFIVVPVVSVMG